jgi:mannose/cellobiose epimerase-like protein (N-acyl-D-glucosamine 2-epimerase family)
MSRTPDFKDPEFLRKHIRWTMDFYHPRALDPTGGMYQFFKNDGTVYDRHTRHLVSSTRFVYTYAMAYRHFDEPGFRDGLTQAFQFLRQAHRNPRTGGYAWALSRRDGKTEVLDATNQCYGLAFVLLAHAHALMAGIDEARAGLYETFALMNTHFWEPHASLYADEATPDWKLNGYRGQNANMHACEAMLAAFEATHDEVFLSRAGAIADTITRRQAALADGLVWEHYHADWSVDWEYNKHDRSNIFRPWGFQPGHQTEWAKLLVILDKHQPRGWHIERAVQLFDNALARAWDEEHGGIYYGLAPDGSICDDEKYHWVQAETFAAAALLAGATGEKHYWDWYQRIWQYCWKNWVDHKGGAWFRILDRRNVNHTDEKSPAGKVDYHNMGACYDALRVLGTK